MALAMPVPVLHRRPSPQRKKSFLSRPDKCGLVKPGKAQISHFLAPPCPSYLSVCDVRYECASYDDYLVSSACAENLSCLFVLFFYDFLVSFHCEFFFYGALGILEANHLFDTLEFGRVNL